MSQIDEVVMCADCETKVDTPMDNGDGKTRCEKCSLDKYKQDHPYTWNIPVFNARCFIDTGCS